MIISYLVVKRKFRTKGRIEFASMLAMAVPGTVLGLSLIHISHGAAGGRGHRRRRRNRPFPRAHGRGAGRADAGGRPCAAE